MLGSAIRHAGAESSQKQLSGNPKDIRDRQGQFPLDRRTYAQTERMAIRKLTNLLFFRICCMVGSSLLKLRAVSFWRKSQSRPPGGSARTSSTNCYPIQNGHEVKGNQGTGFLSKLSAILAIESSGTSISIATCAPVTLLLVGPAGLGGTVRLTSLLASE